MAVINADKYKQISDNIATAKAQLKLAVTEMYSAVYSIALLDDITQSVDLLQPLFTVYQLTDNAFSRTSLFDGAVLALNNHVLRRGGYSTLDSFLAQGAGAGDDVILLPEFWDLCNKLGYNVSATYKYLVA
jgi:hypothetical protein